ncbi:MULTISPECIES: hypothetical protein [Cupriavidus]|uniref:hypothetical protein n=1 Tax=Cupriavidus TaxID=106589 RepID=UPI0012F52294|nr:MULTISPECIES: hypothetical protein [Cupriavidus]
MPYIKAAACLLACVVVSLVLADRYPQYDDALALAGLASGLALAGRAVFRGTRKAS